MFRKIIDKMAQINQTNVTKIPNILLTTVNKKEIKLSETIKQLIIDSMSDFSFTECVKTLEFKNIARS